MTETKPTTMRLKERKKLDVLCKVNNRPSSNQVDTLILEAFEKLTPAQKKGVK